MNFLEFCKSKTTDVGFESVALSEVPDRYKQSTDAMIQIMKPKRKIFDSINVPFVEMTFEEEDYEDILKNNLVDGEIPDGIIYELSMGIFSEYPNRLDASQQSIIKVLSAYICIQN